MRPHWSDHFQLYFQLPEHVYHYYPDSKGSPFIRWPEVPLENHTPVYWVQTRGPLVDFARHCTKQPKALVFVGTIEYSLSEELDQGGVVCDIGWMAITPLLTRRGHGKIFYNVFEDTILEQALVRYPQHKSVLFRLDALISWNDRQCPWFSTEDAPCYEPLLHELHLHSDGPWRFWLRQGYLVRRLKPDANTQVIMKKRIAYPCFIHITLQPPAPVVLAESFVPQ